MKSPLPLPSPPRHPPEVECAMGVFQIQPPISGVNFLNNMLIPQARIVMSEIEHDTTFETSQLLTSWINLIPSCLGKIF